MVGCDPQRCCVKNMDDPRTQERHPAGAVWIVVVGKLMRAAPEHLWHCENEKKRNSLVTPLDGSIPLIKRQCRRHICAQGFVQDNAHHWTILYPRCPSSRSVWTLEAAAAAVVPTAFVSMRNHSEDHGTQSQNSHQVTLFHPCHLRMHLRASLVNQGPTDG